MSEAKKNQALEVIEAEVDRALRRLGLTDRSVLLAVSGGADSLAMLHAVARLGPRLRLRVEVATVDHGLRAEAGDEAARVEATARGLGLTCHRVALQVPAGAGGLEAAAREARYAALERVRATNGLSVVATAHTASDQAETLLMRLARGAALGGAGGILEARGDRVVRPLLSVTRAQVEAYVAALGLDPVVDPMNADPAFLRTRVRREVVPAYSAAACFDVQPALARFARYAAEDDAFLAAEARRALERCWWPDGTLDRVAVTALAPPIGRRVVAAWLEDAGLPLDADVVDQAVRAIVAEGTATLPLDRVLSCANDRVRVGPAPPRRTS